MRTALPERHHSVSHQLRICVNKMSSALFAASAVETEENVHLYTFYPKNNRQAKPANDELL